MRQQAQITCCSTSQGDGVSNGTYAAAQVEAGAQPTSYIPTYSSAVTRSQDLFTVPGTAGGGSGWLTNNVGTLGTVGSIPYSSSNTQAFAALTDGTAYNAIGTYISANLKRTVDVYESGNVYTGNLSPNTSYTLGNTTKMVIPFSASFESGGIDNSLVGNPDGSTSIPATQSTLDIGHLRASYADLDGWVSRIWYMPIVEPDNTLANFTQ
jgi:hypothetical protein